MPHTLGWPITKTLLTAAAAVLLGLTLAPRADAATTWEWRAPWVWSVSTTAPATGHVVPLLVPAPSGSVYAVGREAITRVSTFARLDPDTGVRTWSVTTKGPSRRGVLPAAAVQGPKGDLMVTGSCGRGRKMDVWVARIRATNGAVVWQKTWNGAARRSDAGKAIAVDARGNVYVAGFTDASSGRGDGVVLKYDPSGRRRWAYRLKTGGDDGFADCGVDVLSNLYVTGELRPAGASAQVVTVKLAPGGKLRWRRQFTIYTGDSGGRFIDVGEDTITVAGADRSFADGALSPVAMTYDILGNALWSYAGSDVIAALNGMAVDGEGRIALAGSVAVDSHVTGGWLRVILPGVKGEETWSATYAYSAGAPATYGSSFAAVGADSAGRLYCAGELDTYDEGIGAGRGLLVRYPEPQKLTELEPDAEWTYPAINFETPLGGFRSVLVAADDEVYAGGWQEYTRGLRGMVDRAHIVGP